MECNKELIYDMCLDQGAYDSFLFEYKDEIGNPINLTGATIRFHVKDNYSDEQPVFVADSDETTGSKITIETPATDGKFLLEIVGDDTVNLSIRKTYVQDVLLILDGRKEYLSRGKFKINPTVSRNS